MAYLLPALFIYAIAVTAMALGNSHILNRTREERDKSTAFAAQCRNKTVELEEALKNLRKNLESTSGKAKLMATLLQRLAQDAPLECPPESVRKFRLKIEYNIDTDQYTVICDPLKPGEPHDPLDVVFLE